MRSALAFLALTCAIATAQQPLANPRKLIAAGNFPAAEVSLRTYLVTAPTSAPAHYLLAYSLLRQTSPKTPFRSTPRSRPGTTYSRGTP